MKTQETQPDKFASDKTFTTNKQTTAKGPDPGPPKEKPSDDTPVLLFELASYQLYYSALRVIFKKPPLKSLTPPGKPSTWFPGEGLVTQARLFPSLLLLLFALVLRSCSLILLFDFVFVMILCYGPCSLILSAVLLFNVTFVFTSCFC